VEANAEGSVTREKNKKIPHRARGKK